mmetsp:Transcript_37160/g.77824  ORF Transcript_37160/g.77824 Transcript_37160/m.77824 type:complete len:292 (+) Transcript_37160:135-1010(+)
MTPAQNMNTDMSLPAGGQQPTNGGAEANKDDATQKKRFQQVIFTMRLPNIIQNLIRPGQIPYSLGLRRPPSRIDESSSDCHDITEMKVSRIIHHDENSFQYSLQVSMRFYAVDHTIGQCLPLTKSLNSSKLSQLQSNTSSYLVSSDGGIGFHEINADICVDYSESISSNTLLLFELTGSSPFAGQCGRKAWAFFRPKRLLANFRNEQSPYPDNAKNFNTELQLYKWQKESLLVRKQVEKYIIQKGTLGYVPEVFVQYLMQRRKKFNSCMCLILKPASSATPKTEAKEGNDS